MIEEIRKINPDLKLIFVELDLSKLSSVRNAAQTISLNVETVDILINNAGIMATEPFTKSADGYELQFASNYIGHFLFTNLLMERIFAGGKGARIVNLTSEGHKIGGVNFDDWNFSVCVPIYNLTLIVSLILYCRMEKHTTPG